MKNSEKTITENLLYYIVKYVEIFQNLRIIVQEAYNEPTNGNDLLVYLQLNEKLYYPIAIQAKRIYADGKYHALKGKYNQLQNLKNYARKIGGIPMYLLYNFIDMPAYSSQNYSMNYSLNQFGCSLINASDVEQICLFINLHGEKSLKLRHFNDFHPKYAYPWCMLVCCPEETKSIKSFKDIFRVNQSYDVKGYSLNELQSTNEWIDLAVRELQRPLSAEGITVPEGFAPRYRIIIPNSIRSD